MFEPTWQQLQTVLKRSKRLEFWIPQLVGFETFDIRNHYFSLSGQNGDVFYFRRTEARIAICSHKLKLVIIASKGQQLAILGLSKLVVLLIKRVFHLIFNKPTIIDYII